MSDPTAGIDGARWRCLRPPVRFQEVVDSTNVWALDAGGDGAVYVADTQTAGHGRHGRRWHSARGLGLWLSVAFEAPAEGVLFAAALAVRAAAAPCRLNIKWPNDLAAHGRKICGLLETRRGQRSALGIGLNVNHGRADFPPELRDTAGSLRLLTGTTWNRSELLERVLTRFDEQVMLIRQGNFETVWRHWVEACGLCGRRVRCAAGCGRVAEIARDGALVVDGPAGRRRIVDGPVFFEQED